ncbi:MAG: hypothetical protein ABSF22_16715 [Bryobacteraceae bacterium]|jgi:hypothetical protein
MKTLILTLLAIAAAAIAADKPDFSGTWKMDPDKSLFGPVPPPTSMTRVIDHKDPDLSLHQTSTGPEGDQNMAFKYSTDGKETTNSYMGNEVKSIANWDGKALVIHSNLDVGGQQVKLTEKWTLSDDGKTCTDVLNISSVQGDLDITYIFVRQ